MEPKPPCPKHGADTEWTNPVDAIGGRRACRKCGHIGTKEETKAIVLRELTERARSPEGRTARKIRRLRKRVAEVGR